MSDAHWVRSVRDKSPPARSWGDMLLCKHDRHGKRGKESNEKGGHNRVQNRVQKCRDPGSTRDLQIFSLTLSQLSYRGFTTQSYPTSPNSSRTHAAHHASHARIHWPPASPCVMATHIDLQSAALRPSRDKRAAASQPRHISPLRRSDPVQMRRVEQRWSALQSAAAVPFRDCSDASSEDRIHTRPKLAPCVCPTN